MKYFPIIILTTVFIIFCASNAETILPHTGLAVSTNFAVKGALDAWDTPAVICSTETGCADVVFVIDTSGSMSGRIDELYTEIQEFAYNLESEGYDGAFGLVTFVDAPNFPVGDTLFHDPDAFSDIIAGLNGAEGGFEHPIDASYAAIDTFYRPPSDTCKKVIICITDETEEDSGHSLADLINIATLGGDTVRIYLVSPSGHPMQPACAATGGRWFDIDGTSMNDVLDAVADDIAEFTAITITIHNNTGGDVSDMTVEINPLSCIGLDNPADSIQNTGFVSSGDSAIVNWEIDEVYGCSGCEDCFEITIDAGANVDTVIGCLFVENCDCPGINATVIEPRHCGAYSACDEIVFQFDGCFPVDPNTIVVYVGGSYIYYPDPQLTYNAGDQTLTFHPSTPWPEGASIDFWVDDAQDITGCALRYSQHCNIIVDTTPPVVNVASGFSPPCGTTISESDNITFSASAYDNGAGMSAFMPMYAEITSPSWDPASILAMPGIGLLTIILTDEFVPPFSFVCNGDSTWTSGVPGIPFAGFVGYQVLCTDLSVAAPDCDCGDEEYFFDFDVNAGEIRNYLSPIIPSEYTICFYITDAVDNADCGPNTDTICCTYYFGGCVSPNPFSQISPANGYTAECSVFVDFIWQSSAGTPTMYYDLYVDGSPVATNLTDTTYNYGWIYNTSDSTMTLNWSVYAHNSCGNYTTSIWSINIAPCCVPASVQLGCPYPNCYRFSSCSPQPISFAITDTSGRTIDHNRVFFTVERWHPLTGSSDTSWISGAAPEVSWAGDTAIIDWTALFDGDSVVITLDSLFTTDSCLTIPGP